jgi:ribosomal protein L11 methyltransferase
MIELLLTLPQTLVEAVSDALIEALSALSVSVEDADANGPEEQALFGEPGLPDPLAGAIMGWQRSVVTALFADEASAMQAVTWVMAQDAWRDQVQVQTMQTLAEQDWVRLTQAQFSPMSITPDFWVVPSWHEPPAQAQKLIRLDPGLAFGTGTHPTTRMCLRWLAQQAPALSSHWSRVLDYGCGSGILAIGAALYGAVQVDAVDIDPCAVQATQANVKANAVATQVQTGLPDRAQGRYALVMANILATPLKLMAPLLCAHTLHHGHLVLAGILERQADELKAAYAPWCALQVSDTEEGWILMTAAGLK